MKTMENVRMLARFAVGFPKMTMAIVRYYEMDRLIEINTDREKKKILGHWMIKVVKGKILLEDALWFADQHMIYVDNKED